MVLYFVGSDQEAMRKFAAFVDESDLGDDVDVFHGPYEDRWAIKMIIGDSDEYALCLDFDKAFLGADEFKKVRELAFFRVIEKD